MTSLISYVFLLIADRRMREMLAQCSRFAWVRNARVQYERKLRKVAHTIEEAWYA